MEQRPRVTELIAYTEFGPTEIHCPEMKLWGAVIQRAVLDLQSKAKADSQHRRSARIFLFSDKPNKSPLRYWAELMFTDPDGFIERVRRDASAGVLHPKQVACSTL